jgi:hypothetical protein
MELVLKAAPPRHAGEVPPHVVAAFLRRPGVHNHGVGFHFAALDVLEVPHGRQDHRWRARKFQCLDDSDSAGHGASLEQAVVVHDGQAIMPGGR